MTDSSLGLKWIKMAALYLLVGVGLGIHMGKSHDFTLMPVHAHANLLGWATINGAKALQLENIFGSFEKGKKPGVVLCEASLSGSRRQRYAG